MYLTLEYVVNSFLVGQVKKNLKSTKIVTGFFGEAEGWHPST